MEILFVDISAKNTQRCSQTCSEEEEIRHLYHSHGYQRHCDRSDGGRGACQERGPRLEGREGSEERLLCGYS